MTPVNNLSSDADCCGTAIIEVLDNCGATCKCYVAAPNGHWVYKGDVRGLYGPGKFINELPTGRFNYSLTVGGQMQLQTTIGLGKTGHTECFNCIPNCEIWKAGYTHRGNCIDPDHSMMTCSCDYIECESPGPYNWRWVFYHTGVGSFHYYEWDCE
uniref:Uncharacterized protein n=1 Tax=viral metagenome TaxID=1070528 RepID=A0A6H1Z7I3_9ZZZZ